jgi:hypothetical protein
MNGKRRKRLEERGMGRCLAGMVVGEGKIPPPLCPEETEGEQSAKTVHNETANGQSPKADSKTAADS